MLGFSIWWNFSEAAHGKSAADGVGGTVKRLADSRVLAGEEIQNVSQLYNCLRDITTVKLFLVNQFLTIGDTIRIPPVPGTMKIHQFTAHVDGTVVYRDLTCYCNSDIMCSCYEAKVVNLCPENPCEVVLPQESSAEQLTTCRPTFNELEILNIENSTVDSQIVHEQAAEIECIASSFAQQVDLPMHIKEVSSAVIQDIPVTEISLQAVASLSVSADVRSPESKAVAFDNPVAKAIAKAVASQSISADVRSPESEAVAEAVASQSVSAGGPESEAVARAVVKLSPEQS